MIYDSFLHHQKYYDDLKHVDYPTIVYSIPESGGNVRIRQEKGLGKGGLVWDAAFVLAEYMGREIVAKSAGRGGGAVNIIELGAGTGLTR